MEINIYKGEGMPNIPNHEKKFLIDIRTEIIQKNEFKFAKIEKMITLEEFGIDETYFGGNIYVIAKLKDEFKYLLVNKHHMTLGVCIKLNELDALTKSELIEWAKLNKIRIVKDDTKENIIFKLRNN